MTAKPIPLPWPQRLTKEIAKTILYDLATNHTERVRLTHHARTRMNKRDISLTQILKILSRGAIYDEPFYSIKQNGQLEIEGVAAGDNVKVVVAIDRDEEGNYCAIISVMST